MLCIFVHYVVNEQPPPVAATSTNAHPQPTSIPPAITPSITTLSQAITTMHPSTKGS